MKKVTLGNTANLLYGYDPSWLSEQKGNNALFSSEAEALEEITTDIPGETGKWSLPEISLHDNAESLLDTLLPYKITTPSESLETAVLPSGALLLGDNDRKQALGRLSGTLGVDLEKTNCGYALVQIKREDGEAFHPSNQTDMLIYAIPTEIPEEFKVTHAFQDAASKLKRFKPQEMLFSPESITLKDANDFLQFFRQMGTHFVSKIKNGDALFQIFQMPEQQYKKVKKNYAGHPERLSGPDAVSFIHYTTDSTTGAFGYVQQYGKILNFSQSKILEKSLKEKEWMESTFSETQSIFAPYQSETQITIDTLNKTYKDATALSTELTTLTLFMEYSRRLIWERIFKGAIIQKYQTAVQPRFTRYNPYTFDQKFQQKGWPDLLSDISTPTINLYRPKLNFSELQFKAPKIINDFTLFTNLLTDSGDVVTDIPGKSGLICTQAVALETDNTQAIRLSGME